MSRATVLRAALRRALVNVDAVNPDYPQIRAALESALAFVGPAPPRKPPARPPVRGTKVVRRRV